MINIVTALVEAGMAVLRACGLVGLARSTYYRISRGYQHYRPVTDPIPHPERVQPAALTGSERAEIVDVLERAEYADLSVQQTYWRAFDAGEVVCSQRTFYRVAAAEKLVGDRRSTRRWGHGRKPPVAVASRVNQLWSWDATELKGPGRQRYQLMLIIDVYSRYPIGFKIEYTECYDHAKTLFTTAINYHGIPEVIHADNGSVMRCHDLIKILHDHGAATSYSRPRVSDDNPFSESMFKTIKYDLNCPARFDSIDHARAWTEAFLDNYANHHRHSGLAHHTPASVYHGTVETDRARRQAQLDHYWACHPERFRRQPQAPAIRPTGINTHLLPQKMDQLSQKS